MMGIASTRTTKPELESKHGCTLSSSRSRDVEDTQLPKQSFSAVVQRSGESWQVVDYHRSQHSKHGQERRQRRQEQDLPPKIEKHIEERHTKKSQEDIKIGQGSLFPREWDDNKVFNKIRQVLHHPDIIIAEDGGNADLYFGVQEDIIIKVVIKRGVTTGYPIYDKSKSEINNMEVDLRQLAGFAKGIIMEKAKDDVRFNLKNPNASADAVKAVRAGNESYMLLTKIQEQLNENHWKDAFQSLCKGITKEKIEIDDERYKKIEKWGKALKSPEDLWTKIKHQ